jgi:hypothetical protein
VSPDPVYPVVLILDRPCIQFGGRETALVGRHRAERWDLCPRSLSWTERIGVADCDAPRALFAPEHMSPSKLLDDLVDPTAKLRPRPLDGDRDDHGLVAKGRDNFF